ncbi:Equilibrative nucleoside transporter 4 [Myotis davidii]|uniref:Equilibrative nucleoside transporter 4 n=1 Tax=Myotis davidii TaxID=225400 RepID=L5LSG1_MYODS|nr:Equilibrative nucleoside transporter 4 [Myotis davidii]
MKGSGRARASPPGTAGEVGEWSPPHPDHSRPSPAGYLLALGPLLFISICDVWLQLFSRDQAYAINLAAVGTVAFGCTVQQSSFYGYTGMLPKRYTQGVMTGEMPHESQPSPRRAVTASVPPGDPTPRSALRAPLRRPSHNITAPELALHLGPRPPALALAFLDPGFAGRTRTSGSECQTTVCAGLDPQDPSLTRTPPDATGLGVRLPRDLLSAP